MVYSKEQSAGQKDQRKWREDKKFHPTAPGQDDKAQTTGISGHEHEKMCIILGAIL